MTRRQLTEADGAAWEAMPQGAIDALMDFVNSGTCDNAHISRMSPFVGDWSVPFYPHGPEAFPPTPVSQSSPSTQSAGPPPVSATVTITHASSDVEERGATWPSPSTPAHDALRDTLRLQLEHIASNKPKPLPRLVPDWTPEALADLGPRRAAVLVAVAAVFARLVPLIGTLDSRLCLCLCGCRCFFFTERGRGRPPRYYEEHEPQPRDNAAYMRQNRKAHRALRAGSERAARRDK